MSQPFIRDGKLVGSPFEGISYDLTQLSLDQGLRTNAILDKSRSGYCLTVDDISHLMKVRKAARTASIASPLDRLADAVRQFREAFK